jgi:hypothetical protein
MGKLAKHGKLMDSFGVGYWVIHLFFVVFFFCYIIFCHSSFFVFYCPNLIMSSKGACQISLFFIQLQKGVSNVF